MGDKVPNFGQVFDHSDEKRMIMKRQCVGTAQMDTAEDTEVNPHSCALLATSKLPKEKTNGENYLGSSG